MKTYSGVMAAAVIFGLISLQLALAERPASKASPACTPNGNRFDLEPLTNAALQSQYGETVAVIANRGSNGDDLVVGGALDERVLNPELGYDGFYNSAYYVERANSICAADFEGGLPITGELIPIGTPMPAADPAHGAFFIGTLATDGINFGVSMVKSTTATLLNPSSCPNGTESGPAICWPIAGAANTTASEVQNPSLAVDQRTSGTGAGDVYVAATTYIPDETTSQITLSACANANLACGATVVVSGSDDETQYPSVQVQPGGGITVAYQNVVVPFGEVQFKFVNCTPRGAPNPPACGTPTLVISEPNPIWGTPGAIYAFFPQMPYHVDRLESNGKTVTSFLIYDQCAVPNIGDYFCAKAQVVMTFSTDGGKTWSPLQIVGAAKGQQFLGNIALDVSTGTVNIAYLSSQNDALQIHTQIFLAQVLPSQTTVSPPHQITTALYDGPYGYEGGESDLSVAASGTGQTGQSRVYIHFTGSVAQGIYNKQPFPIYHNTLTRFEY